MDITFEYQNKTIIARITGELDHHATEQLRARVDSRILTENISNLILDFSQVSFMDSSGIGFIIGRYKNMSDINGCMCVIGGNEYVGRMIRMSAIEKIVPVFNTISEGLVFLKQAEDKKTADR